AHRYVVRTRRNLLVPHRAHRAGRTVSADPLRNRKCDRLMDAGVTIWIGRAGDCDAIRRRKVHNRAVAKENCVVAAESEAVDVYGSADRAGGWRDRID